MAIMLLCYTGFVYLSAATTTPSSLVLTADGSFLFSVPSFPSHTPVALTLRVSGIVSPHTLVALTLRVSGIVSPLIPLWPSPFGSRESFSLIPLWPSAPFGSRESDIRILDIGYRRISNTPDIGYPISSPISGYRISPILSGYRISADIGYYTVSGYPDIRYGDSERSGDPEIRRSG